ncbi:hypothetical protein BM477_00850 [Boudabousia marimammalium]|uniref:Class E sortase n=1 Tax=Boudabousia marimammalium TaxID=156892 RepID=A0A1Q5PT90_9ACTO|nr:hypothetical protein BM477_00850 [Boudabousia marimammalium]
MAATTSKQPRTAKQWFRWGFFNLIGAIGEIFILAAYVVGMFLVWQVYWTTFEVEGVRQEQVSTWHEQLPEAPQTVSNDLRYDAPPPIGPVNHGDVFATMYVPRWNMLAIPIAQGEDQYILDQAFAGHYVNSIKTAMPGELGNFSVAAHRRSYGNSFREIDTLQPGDPIVVETKDAYLIFHVYQHQLVLPEQVEVIHPVPGQPMGTEPTERLMTLTTCATATGGQFGNSHRYIQHLKLDHWVPRSSGIPVELTQSGGN